MRQSSNFSWLIWPGAFLFGFLPLLPASDWQAEEGWSWRTLEEAKPGAHRFELLEPSVTHVDFKNLVTERSGAANRVLYNGSGVAVGDYDGDGLPDVFFCGLETDSRLYRNLGSWRFVDATLAAGLKVKGVSHRGATFSDLDGDGDLDLLVSSVSSGVTMFRNQGKGEFESGVAIEGRVRNAASMTMTLADIDGNGSLDLYVANYRPSDIRDQGRINLPVRNGQVVVPPVYQGRLLMREGQLSEQGQADQVFLNDGTGRLHEMSWLDGSFLDHRGVALQAPRHGWGLSASFRDLNGDLRPDLYVCNDYWTPDDIWINQGRGVFQLIAPLALRKMSASSMGVDFADYDRDGDLDLFVVDMLSRDAAMRKRQLLAQKPEHDASGRLDFLPQRMRNTLFRNRGDLTFEEVAHFAGVAASDWSWCPIFMDVDLDGYQDLLISAGHFKDTQDEDADALIRSRQKPRAKNASPEAIKRTFVDEMVENNRLYPDLKMPIVAFHNLGNGRFKEVTDDWGTEALAVHHGMATGDFDLDGDLDIVVNNLGSTASFYRNNAVEPRLSVQLVGEAGNTQGVGALVELVERGEAGLAQEVADGGRYLSDSDATLVFGTPRIDKQTSLKVTWRDGRVSLLTKLLPGRAYRIQYSGAGKPEADGSVVAEAEIAKPLFTDRSELIPYYHRESLYDDDTVQPLLPFKLSQSGPKLLWHDLNRDNHLDLIIGGSRGGVVSVFLNDGKGGFSDALRSSRLTGDIVGLVSFEDERESSVLVGITGFESGRPSAVARLWLEGAELQLTSVIDKLPPSIGCLVGGDVDRDGDLDLFVGGGGFPGRYPDAGNSGLYLNEGRDWKLDRANGGRLGVLGVVRDAVWQDLDADGDLDLIVASEWQPIRVFTNLNGRFIERTRQLGLQAHVGLWQCVVTGDFNGDGHRDLLAGNWGLNSPMKATVERPFLLVYGDFASRGQNSLLETEYDDRGRLVVSRPFNELAESLPFLYERFASFKQFSRATVAEVLGDRAKEAKQIGATTFASMVFYGDGHTFRAEQLPAEFQLSPVMDASVAELNGDGIEDVLLAQNSFDGRPGIGRLDDGLTSVGLGQEEGPMLFMQHKLSGLKVHGRPGSLDLGDFDGDGLMDVAIGQNGESLRLFRKNVP